MGWPARALPLATVLSVACADRPAPAPAAAAAPGASAVAKNADAGTDARATPATGDDCLRERCRVTTSVIEITPFNTALFAADGTDVLFLHPEDSRLELRKRGEKADRDIVLAADVRATESSQVSQIVVRGDTMFFAESDGVVSWERKTSLLTNLHPGSQDHPAKRVAVDDSHVYFATYDCTIARVPKAGGKVEELAKFSVDSCEYPDLVVDDQTVWFTPGKSDHIFAIPKTKGRGLSAKKTALSKRGNVWGLTADADNLYAIVGEPGPGKLLRIPKKGGAPVELFKPVAVSSYYVLASDGDRLYWFDVVATKSVVAMMPKTGGARRVLATLDASEQPMMLSIGASSVYWVGFPSSETPAANQPYLYRVGK